MKKIVDVVDKKLAGTITNDTVIGIDIGSRTGKAVLLTEG
ncbi:MAG: hgdC, partial [Sporomusa sp.]|nr:hgdC [Sporomusa sp.]